MSIDGKSSNITPEKEREKITGFVFEISQLGQIELATLALPAITDDEKEMIYKALEVIREKLENCEYKVDTRFDYGYIIELKVELPEPIETYRGYHEKADRLRDEIIEHFWNEHKLGLNIQKEKEWILKNKLSW